MMFETRRSLGQVADLMDSIVSVCLTCHRVYRVVPAAGAPPGVSDGYCSEECIPNA